MGLPLEPGLAKACNFMLDCAVLEKDNQGNWRISPKSNALVIRPLTLDSWSRSTSCSRADWPGFCQSSQGGFEFKLLPCPDSETQAGPLYIYIRLSSSSERQDYPSPAASYTLPLAIGPLTIAVSDLAPMHCHHQAQQQQQQTHRVLGYQVGNQLNYFLLKEKWGYGTPGKLWDAALVLSSMFSKACSRNPNYLAGRRVVDLSAGQAIQLEQGPEIILTDLVEALTLIRENHQLNNKSNACQNLADIQTLAWGERSDAERVKNGKPVDIVIASDLLYNVSDFANIIQTFRHLSTPGRTVIYLGYKRRGFKEKEETEFFRLCKPYFHVSLARDQHDQLVDWEKQMGCLSVDWCIKTHKYTPETVDSLSDLLHKQGIRIYRLVCKT
ncbi:hypothetical protein DFQ29_004500 [Apophysomyces sp. BC1021]|nr:hypothetical protein DFQ29_004500 [Apophysomyces sp. BC1021]